MGLPFLAFTDTDLINSGLFDVSDEKKESLYKEYGCYHTHVLFEPDNKFGARAGHSGEVHWVIFGEKKEYGNYKKISLEEVLSSVSDETKIKLLFNLDLTTRTSEHFREY